MTEAGHRLPLSQVSRTAFGKRVICGIRPEHLTLSEDGLAAEVVVVEPTGSEIQVNARIDGHDIVAVFRERHLFKPGERISLIPQPGAIHLFDADTGRRL